MATSKVLPDEIIVGSVTSLPSSGEVGQIVFNEADGKMYYWNGSEWVALG